MAPIAKRKEERTCIQARSDEIDIAVGATLRQIRLTRGVSQNELARYLGVTFQQVQKYEKGQNRMGASALYRTAEFLDVSIEDLFVAASLKEQRERGRISNGGRVVATIFPADRHECGVPEEEIIVAISEFQKIRDRSIRAIILQLVKCMAVEQTKHL